MLVFFASEGQREARGSSNFPRIITLSTARACANYPSFDGPRMCAPEHTEYPALLKSVWGLARWVNLNRFLRKRQDPFRGTLCLGNYLVFPSGILPVAPTLGARLRPLPGSSESPISRMKVRNLDTRIYNDYFLPDYFLHDYCFFFPDSPSGGITRLKV